MKKIFLILIILVIIIAGLSLSMFQRASKRTELVIQPIGHKGIFVGDRKLAPELERSPEIKSRQLREQEEHLASLRAIDEAAEYIRLGDRHANTGRDQEAVVAYKKAYSVGGGSRAVSGLLLAMTYEKLGQYDEGIILLDEMIQKGYLSNQGIQNANEIRARLLRIKTNLNSKFRGHIT